MKQLRICLMYRTMILQLHFAEDFVVAFTRYNWEIPYAYE
jgi:hypothetical protein